MKPAAALILACAALAHHPARAAPSDATQISLLEDGLAAAASARDVNGIMKAYINNESLFVFDVSPPRQYVGAKAYRKDWENLLATMKDPIKFTISDLDVTVAGPVAYGHSIQRLAGTDTKGNPVDLTVRVSDVYRKIGGYWVIVQEHVSVPVDLDTLKPDLTSKP